MAWTDSHCHLEYGPEATGQLAAELQQAATAGVTRMVDVGTDEQRSRLAIEHANASHESDAPAQVWATAGLHPHDSEQGWKWLEPLLQDAEHTRIVGVGECGLDYHYDHSPRDEQRTAFAAQIRLAHQYGLALVIHTRAAWLDTFAILGAEGVPARTVFHCFTGGPHEAERALALADGVVLSFSGIVTFKSAQESRDAALLCPLDRMLVETDSPYLAPVPHRGRPNVPANVMLVGAAIATVKGVDVAAVEAATWANAAKVFGLPG